MVISSVLVVYDCLVYVQVGVANSKQVLTKDYDVILVIFVDSAIIALDVVVHVVRS